MTADLDALERLVAAATALPWHVDKYDCYIWGPNAEMVADRGCGELPPDAIVRMRGVGGGLPIAANMALIVAACNALSTLISLSRAKEDLERDRVTLDRICWLAAEEDLWFGHEGDIKAQRAARDRHASSLTKETGSTMTSPDVTPEEIAALASRLRDHEETIESLQGQLAEVRAERDTAASGYDELVRQREGYRDRWLACDAEVARLSALVGDARLALPVLRTMLATIGLVKGVRVADDMIAALSPAPLPPSKP